MNANLDPEKILAGLLPDGTRGGVVIQIPATTTIEEIMTTGTEKDVLEAAKTIPITAGATETETERIIDLQNRVVAEAGVGAEVDKGVVLKAHRHISEVLQARK